MSSGARAAIGSFLNSEAQEAQRERGTRASFLDTSFTCLYRIRKRLEIYIPNPVKASKLCVTKPPSSPPNHSRSTHWGTGAYARLCRRGQSTGWGTVCSPCIERRLFVVARQRRRDYMPPATDPMGGGRAQLVNQLVVSHRSCPLTCQFTCQLTRLVTRFESSLPCF